MCLCLSLWPVPGTPDLEQTQTTFIALKSLGVKKVHKIIQNFKQNFFSPSFAAVCYFLFVWFGA